MADCSNVEIRELLPERAGGALSAADIARVDAHLASCGLCTAELALINAARRSLRVAPSIDTARISARVIAATAAPSRPQLVTTDRERAGWRPASRLHWIGWKAAAAITIAAAGIGSFAVWQSTDDAAVPNAATMTGTQAPAATAATAATATRQPATPAPLLVASAAPASRPAELGVGGGLGELSSGDLQALLGDLGGSGGGMLPADASFEDPEVVIPDVGDVTGWESL